ncbi:hypothetical protein [Aurantiacibacter hainanensis]|uniref:hypothetical protein n=1 Tax=Aurantiacibacter hainanensis TaxID=3076114 RepID=UPI0030C6DCA5
MAIFNWRGKFHAVADLLLALRMTGDAFSTEVEARAEAPRAFAKLRIVSHELCLEY